MFIPRITGGVCVQAQRGLPRSIQRQSLVFSQAVRLVCGRLFTDHHSLAQRKRAGALCRAVASHEGGFTLLELLIVLSIIGILLVLLAPAFTSLKGGTDVTSAAYTIKGVLDTARTYAKANNTYAWVGFYEEDVSSGTPGTAGTGRVVMSIVASKDGTKVYDANSTSINPTRLIQVGKLVKIENIHLGLPPLGTGTPPGDTFDSRPSPTPAPAYDSRFGELNGSPTGTAPTQNSQYPFQYPVGDSAPLAQYTFQKTLQFNPRGESNINSGLGVGGMTYDVKRIVEVGLQATHGTQVDTISPNLVAVQITGFGGNVKIYRR